MFRLVRYLKRWFCRYYKTEEFRPRADDSVISIVDQNSIIHFTYRDLGSSIQRWVQLSEHGRFSGRRHYTILTVYINKERKEYRCRILSSRPIDIMRM